LDAGDRGAYAEGIKRLTKGREIMTVEYIRAVQPRIADGRNAIRHVFIRDLVLVCRIGVHRHEQRSSQRVRINLDLAVRDDGALQDDLNNVVCYERITDGVRQLISRRHIRLVETLAEEIADFCLIDRRVRSARIRVEKLDVFRDAASVGVEIERFSPF
jgi:dihydroneopterin aldolase